MSKQLIEKTIYEFFNVLNESRADKLAIKFLKSKGVTDYNEQMKIIGHLKHDVPNIRECHGKFVLGGLRCYYNHELSDNNDIIAFDKALGYIFKGNHQDDYDENLNGLSVSELTDMFKDIAKTNLRDDIERSNNRIFTSESDYTVIPIHDFSDSKKYSKYTSWCITKKDHNLQAYTCNNRFRFYFCLKKGFENISKQQGPGCPLDEYGLSMISVLVDNLEGGSVERITTRWNHDYNGENNNNLCTAEQLENIINLPFYKTFLPYTKDELRSLGCILFDDVQRLLDSGRDPETIFDDIFPYRDKYARVKLNNKYNFIDRNNKILLSEWYNFLRDFSDGYAWCSIGIRKHNFTDEKGNLLFKHYFCLDDTLVHHKYAIIDNDKKKNIIDTDENIILNEWVDDITYVKEYDVFIVRNNEKDNLMDMNFKYLLNDDDCPDRIYQKENGLVAWKNNLCRYITANGKFITSDYQKNMEKLGTDVDLYAVTRKGNNRNEMTVVDSNSNQIIDKWFHNVSCDNGYIVLKHNGKYNILNTDGTLMFNRWYDSVTCMDNGIISVQLKNKETYMNNKGNNIINEWFDKCSYFISGFGKVEKDGKFNFVDINGKLLSDIWFDGALSFFDDNYAIVCMSKKRKTYDLTDSLDFFEHQLLNDYNLIHKLHRIQQKDANWDFKIKLIYKEFISNGYNMYFLDKAGKLYKSDMKNYKIDSPKIELAEDEINDLKFK